MIANSWKKLPGTGIGGTPSTAQATPNTNATVKPLGAGAWQPKPAATTPAAQPAAKPVQPAPAGQSAIRQYLLDNGIGNDQIGYNKANNSVTVGGQSFISPATVQGGTSYATKDSLDQALSGYKTRQTQSKAEELLKAMEAGIGTGYTPGTFSYDPENDPVYQAALSRARANSGYASGNAMAELASRGILDSTITGDRVAQIGQDAMSDVSANLLPQLFSQAYQRFNDTENRNYNISRDKVLDTASYLKSILEVNNDRQNDEQQQWENRYNYGNAIGTFSNGQKTVAQKTLDENTRQYNEGVAYQKGRDEVTDGQWNKSYELEKTGQANSNALGWANHNLSKSNSATDNSRQAANDSYNKLMDIWQATGKAPAGIAGVPEGTPYGQQASGIASYEDAYKDIDNSLYIQKEVDENGQTTGRYSVSNPKGLGDYIISLDLPEAETKRLYQRYGLPWGDSGSSSSIPPTGYLMNKLP